MIAQDRLYKYARLLVQTGCALAQGQELLVSAPVEAAAFVRLVAQAAWELGAGEVTVQWTDQGLSRLRYLHADPARFESVPDWERTLLNGAAERQVAYLNLRGDDPDGMADVDPARLTASSRAAQRDCKPFYSMRGGNGARCIAGVPTPGWARKVFPGVSEEEAMDKLWEAILATTRTDDPDPARTWAELTEGKARRKELLNGKQFDALHYTAANGTDLTVGMNPGHTWVGGGAKKADGTPFFPNMPTEEVFTSPDRERADGIVYAAMPLVYQGGLIEDFWVKFEHGRAVDCGARVGEERLRAILSVDEGSCYLGEAALVPHDSPISQLGILFYFTLFDENAACHLALGKGFPMCLPGGPKMSEEELKAHHLNVSAAHVDFMIGTADMNITGIMKDGTEVPIFVDGNWGPDFM